MDRRRFLGGLCGALALPHAAPAAVPLPPDRVSVVVVMKHAGCPVCLAEIAGLRALGSRLDAHLTAVTHEAPERAAEASLRSGVAVHSDTGWIVDRGLFVPDRGHARPAVLIFDRCGREAGRVIGRGPGVLAAPEVLRLRDRIVEAPCAGAIRS